MHEPPSKASNRPMPKGGKKAIKIVLKKGSGNPGARKRKLSSANDASISTGARKERVPALLRSVPECAPSVSGARACTDDDYDAICDALPSLGSGELDVPCDTLLALQSLISKDAAAICPLTSEDMCMHFDKRGVPFVLKPMLHHALLSSVSSKSNSDDAGDNAGCIKETNKILSASSATGVTMELDDLRRRNIVRLLKMQGSGDLVDSGNDVAIMETSWFELGVRDAFVASAKVIDGGNTKEAFSAAASTSGANRQRQQEQLNDLRRCYPDLSQWVLSNLPNWNQAFVNYEAIESSLAALPLAFRDATRVIDHLVGIGLLLPRRASSASFRPSDRSYWFTLPGLGRASQSITDGRLRVLNKIRHSNYGEMKRSVLEVGMVPSSRRGGAGQSLVGRQGSSTMHVEMSAAFHIRDLLSRGQIAINETPAGQFVRLIDGAGKTSRSSYG